MTKAMRPEDATRGQLEEANRKVRDLVNYLAKYDDPSFKERLGTIKSPEGVLIIIQSERKFERGSGTSTAITAVGSFSPVAIAIAVKDFLVESEEAALLGKEIK